MGEDRGDALGGEGADRDFRPGGVKPAIKPQDAEAGAEALFGVGAFGEHGDDERLCVSPIVRARRRKRSCSTWRIAGVRAACGRAGAVTWSAKAARMGGNALTAVEHLHRARGQPCLDLLADQRVRDRVEEAGGLDVIVDTDPGERPFGILVLGSWQRPHAGRSNGLEQFAPADPEAAHHTPVQPHQDLGDRRVAFGEREELQVAQPAQQVELSDAYSGLDFGFILR